MAAVATVGARQTKLTSLLPGFDAYPHAGDPVLEELSARALEAARAAGATYADVRFTLTRNEVIRWMGNNGYSIMRNTEYAAVGVRALVDGAWGFTASPLWTKDEVARLGHEAAVQARTNARGGKAKITIGDPPPVVKGEWKTPIKRDPFQPTMAEKMEIAYAYGEAANRLNLGSRNVSVGSLLITDWQRQEKTFASTDGSYTTQTLYMARPSFSIGVVTPKGRAGRSSDIMLPKAGGFEVVTDAPLVDEMPRLVEDSILMVDAEKITPNRYDIVFDARAMASIVGRSVGVATELDRVLGFEANAGGTSYLAPPDEKLGAFQVGSPMLNVRANRSNPVGLTTVKWDDEGVAPDEYQLVKDGVLVDYHTTRAIAGDLGFWYSKTGAPVRSHGCASAASAIGVTMLHTPNIEMVPGKDDTTMDDMISGLQKGLVICAGGVSIDRQQLNGEFNGEMVYEVIKGKRTRFLHSSEIWFRSPDFWKELIAVGGKATQKWSGDTVYKGQPTQEWSFGIAGVPALVRKVPVTDRMKKG